MVISTSPWRMAWPTLMLRWMMMPLMGAWMVTYFSASPVRSSRWICSEIGPVRKRELERHADRDVREIGLIHVRIAPHVGEISDGHQHLALADGVADTDVALDDDAAHGRVDGDVLLRLAGALEPLDLLRDRASTEARARAACRP